MPSPSASFSINGGSSLVKAAVSASSTVTCVLDSLDGVRQVEWSIANTDGTSSPANYSLNTSGPLGSTMTTTSLTAGKSARVRCRINAGVDANGAADNTTTAEAKFYVAPETLCADEFNDADRISSLTHGAAATINPGLRNTLSTDPSYTTVEASAFKSTGTEATAGLLRATNNSTIVAARNAANSQNLVLVATDASDSLKVGDSSDVSKILFDAKTSGYFAYSVNGTERVRIGDGFVQVGTTNAASGNLRVPNNVVSLAARNAANSGDINLVSTDGSDNVTIGDSSDATAVIASVKTGGKLQLSVNGTEVGNVTGSGYLTLQNTAGAPNGVIVKATTNGILSLQGVNVGFESTEAGGGTTQMTLSGTTLLFTTFKGGVTKKREVFPADTQTTDATVTTLLALTLSDNTTYNLHAFVTADENGGTNSAGYERVVTVKRTGGGAATIVGTVSTPHTAEDVGAWDCTFTVSGNDVLLRATGAAATTIDWSSVITVTAKGA